MLSEFSLRSAIVGKTIKIFIYFSLFIKMISRNKKVLPNEVGALNKIRLDSSVSNSSIISFCLLSNKLFLYTFD